jgi:hypothetical protein
VRSYLDRQGGVKAGRGSRVAGKARKMQVTTIAAKLRQVANDMEIMAAMDGDWDYPDELVIPFIIMR